MPPPDVLWNDDQIGTDFMKTRYPDTDDLESRYRTLRHSYFKKGITIALASGIAYGLYTAFINLAMSKGVWADWYGPNTQFALSAFVITFVLGAVATSINDSLTAVMCLGFCTVKGKVKDVFRTICSKPGAIICGCALVGGPLAATSYLISIKLIGSLAVPIMALDPAIGALLGHLIYKQKLNGRMVAGVIVCFSASAVIGSSALLTGGGGSVAISGGKLILGCFTALIGAFSYGLEGCVVGHATSVVDPDIAVTIRECTSAIGNMLILLPILCLIAGNIGLEPELLGAAWTSGSAMVVFVFTAVLSVASFLFWYRGNGMCGAALGMACNGTYSFWGPFCCWSILGVALGMSGWSLYPIQWVCAVVMMLGILLIATDPRDLFHGRAE